MCCFAVVGGKGDSLQQCRTDLAEPESFNTFPNHKRSQTWALCVLLALRSICLFTQFWKRFGLIYKTGVFPISSFRLVASAYVCVMY